MTGTLTSSMALSSLRLVPETPLPFNGPSRFASNLSFSERPAMCKCKASLHAAVAEPAPVIETMKKRPTSLYEVLRVNRNASPTEIKTAYRSLAKVYHPDAADFKEDGRDFIEIHNAYATLSDPTARAIYDLSLGRRPFGYSTVGNRSGFYPTRRWETDQCW